MANENITINMENLNKEERKQLLSLIDKANKPQSNVWTPQEDELYWYLSSTGYISRVKNFQSPSDFHSINIGNCFKTEAEAKFAFERLKLLHELKVLANGFKPIKGRTTLCFLAYNGETDKIHVQTISCTAYRFNDIYFETGELAQKAIKTIGEKRLKKYYFGIED